MERTVKKVKKNNDEAALPSGVFWWRKIGGGSFHTTINGKVKIIKPNQRFAAREEEIPDGFRDVVVPADEKTAKILEKNATETRPTQKLEYFINHRGGGYYDVLDKNNKRQNTKSLRQEDAQALVENLVGK